MKDKTEAIAKNKTSKAGNMSVSYPIRPSKLQPGDELLVYGYPESRIAIFIKRHPAVCGRKAFNVLRFPDLIISSIPETGDCTMSDYDLVHMAKHNKSND
jgi:hypothetical protein